MYQLRGHHLFCLLGFRGLGYSDEYTENMKRVHQTLRKDPKTLVKLVEGPDQLCEKFPDSEEYHCEDHHIDERDSAILEKLGLKIGQILSWEDIENAVRQQALPSDIGTLCESCSWRSYGVCEEGVQEMIDGKGLRRVK